MCPTSDPESPKGNQEVLEPFVVQENGAESVPLKEGPKAKWKQFYAAFAAHLGAWIMATVWSWSSTALPSLRQSHESIGHLTIWQEAWIASITFLAGATGSLVVGTIAQRFGLRNSLIIASFPLLMGWCLITSAVNIEMILVGRFITGFCVAGVGVSTSLIAEYSNPKRRGRLNFLFDIMFCFGVLFIYIIGTFTSWRVQAGLCGLICVVFIVLLFTIPESPKHLVGQGKVDQARNGLRMMRDYEDVEHELTKIQQEVNQEQEINAANVDQNGWKGQFKTFLTKPILKPVFLCICLQFFLQVCGVVPIVCYAVDVFKAAGIAQVHENVSTIILGAINLVASSVAFFIVDKYGRRKLLIGSEIFLTASLVGIGTFLYFKDGGDGVNSSLEKYSAFLLAFFILYITAYSFGVGPLPWVYSGEIISTEAKGISNGVIILAARIFGFLVMFYFKDMIIIFGQHGVYWFFSVVCFCGAIFTYFMLPETKGKSLGEIKTLMAAGWFYN